MGKYRALGQLLMANPIFVKQLRQPRPSRLTDLTRAHPRSYVEAVMSGEDQDGFSKRLGLPFDKAVARRASLAAAGSLAACHAAIMHGLAFNAAGGSHHADAAGGRGFCTFNDAAIGALGVMSAHPNMRVTIFDLDVHQGDGTADMLAHHERATTISLHCEANYPHPKSRSTHDLSLPPGVGDEAYLAKLEEALDLLTASRPDLVIYNAGVDVHVDDRLGRLCVTDRGLRMREARVLRHVITHQLPTAIVMGGGYGHDDMAIARRHFMVFEEAYRLVACKSD